MIFLSLLMLAFGLVSIYSASLFMTERLSVASHHFVVNQAIGAICGILLLVVGARVPYRLWGRLAWPALFAAFLALLLLVLPWTEAIAPVRNGARRWLSLGVMSVQPSEFAKVALIAWTASFLTRKQALLGEFKRGLLPLCVVWGIALLLVFLEPNLSAALVIIALCMIVAFAGGVRIRHFLLLAALGLPVIAAKAVSADYRADRLATFLDPTRDTGGASYQINQALIALGSGGVGGRGFGAGQQKYGFLPEPHNDFILAMIGEEWGFIGVVVLSALFFAFVATGMRIARRAPDLFGFLLATGLTSLIGLHAILHFGVNTALLPATGVTLPFFSYGRSSLFVCLFSVGILANIANSNRSRT